MHSKPQETAASEKRLQKPAGMPAANSDLRRLMAWLPSAKLRNFGSRVLGFR